MGSGGKFYGVGKLGLVLVPLTLKMGREAGIRVYKKYIIDIIKPK